MFNFFCNGHYLLGSLNLEVKKKHLVQVLFFVHIHEVNINMNVTNDETICFFTSQKMEELETGSLTATLEHGPSGDQETEIFDCTQFIQTAQSKRRQTVEG